MSVRTKVTLIDLPAEGIVTFDIGGTWFRSGLVTSDGNATGVSCTSAINFKNSPLLNVDELQQGLIEYLLERSRCFQNRAENAQPRFAAIALGAAINGNTGLVLNSGPLWGTESKPLDLSAELNRREPTIEWAVVNDVTAELLWNVRQWPKPLKRASLITVSTGVGSRIYDGHRNYIPVDFEIGIQGEIGHLPIAFFIGDQRIARQCDCGGLNHLNAFCSGRGIEAILPLAAEYFKRSFEHSSIAGKAPSALTFADLVDAARLNNAFAVEVVNLVTLPVAEMILRLFTFDPEIEVVFLTGGVVHSLHPFYMDAVLGHLNRLGLYLVSQFNPSFFKERLALGCADGQSGLKGAALAFSVRQEEGLSN
ncbi:MAG: ROK family protein [Candidatus Methylumidiphilus sp.]